MNTNGSPRTTKRNATLIAASLLTVALWIIPGGSYLTFPLLYLNTIIHEFSHALAATATGGSVLGIRVESNGSGTTLSIGGIGLLISSAGYVGAALVGALLIVMGRTEKSARSGLVAISVVLLLGAIIWIRNPLGIGLALIWALAAGLWAKYQSGDALRFGIQFLGMQQCLNALQSLWVLFQINTVPGIDNDAAIASREFPIPPLAYAVGWCVFSGLLMVLALKWAWSGSSNSRAG